MLDRPRLYRELDRWSEKRAIVIHAPTGYGKSSLVSRWLDISGYASRTAWLSLDEADNDPRLFLYHLVAALDRVIPGALALIEPILEDSRGDVERALMRLFSTFWDGARPDALPDDQHTLLVLDDLHSVESADVDTAILTILEQGPENLHLLLISRQRTSLSLARLYAHEKIAVLTGEDLRFTGPETREYLRKRGFVHPTETEVKQLVSRSEGWVTALQLAVLARRGHNNVADLIQTLHGENIWLAEYLTDEVLNQQTPELRRFLLQTSILDEFNAPLCAAVTGVDSAHIRLAEIARADLFLIQLDEGRTWFRYHHLFQELLQHRLQEQTETALIADLHQRAATWLADAGYVHTAVRHLLAAGKDRQAAELVEQRIRSTLLSDPYEAKTLLGLLPHNILTQRPQLMLDRCRLAALFDDKQIVLYTQEAGRTLQGQQSDADAARYHAEWLVLTMGSSFIQRDFGAAASYAEQVQAQFSLLDVFHAGLFHFLQMHLYHYEGRRVQAVQAAEAALTAFERADIVGGEVALRRELARWSMRGGDSAEANRRFEELFDDWKPDQLLIIRDLVIAYFYAAENSYWQNHLEQAQMYQQSGLALANQLQDPQLSATAAILGMLLREATQESEAIAETFLASFEQFASQGLLSLYLGTITHYLISVGRSDAAWQIVQMVGLNPESMPADQVHRNLITYLQAAIVVGVDQAAATQILAEALALARENNDRFDLLQLLALKAWQQLKVHDAPASTGALLEAAHLANETGYVRVLLDIPELVYLLKKMGVSLATGSASTNGAVLTTHEAVMLTEQELRVLELLAADYSYQQIADDLVISINTVRTHVRHIYRKLSVNRRDQAIYQALRHNLLPVATGLSRGEN